MDLHDTSRSGSSTAIICVVALILQVALSPQIDLFGGRINFMLALSIVFAFSGDARRAVVAGFFCGLFYDLTASVPVGLMALLLTIGSFVLSNTPTAQVGAAPADTIRLSFLYCLVVCLIYAIALLIMGVRGDFVSAVIGHGLASAILTALASIPFLLLGGAADGGYRSFSARGGRSRIKGIK